MPLAANNKTIQICYIWAEMGLVFSKQNEDRTNALLLLKIIFEYAVGSLDNY